MIRNNLILVLLFSAFSFGSCASKKEATSEMSMPGLVTVQNLKFDSDDSGSTLTVGADGEVKYNIFKLVEPERIVVDIIDAKASSSLPSSLRGNAFVHEVKVNVVDDSLSSLVRLEILLKSSANYIADQSADKLVIRLIAGEAASADVASSAATAVAPAEVTPDPVVEDKPVDAMPTEALPSTASAPVPSSDLPASDIPSIPLPVADTSESAPKMEPLKEMEEVKPLPVAKKETEKKKSDLIPLKPVQTQEVPSTDFSEGASLLTDLDTKIYTGRRVSLEFQDADVQDILRLIADVSKLNIVTGDDVKGKLSLKLIDVPWDQALDIILATLGLDKMQHGNILRVAPSEKLRKEREVALANDKAAKQLEPLRLKLININYARAEELSARIRNLLSERGTVDIDSRTNTLIVKDIREHLSRAENLVKALDTQTPQVRIEARIVLANDNFQRDLGIQWGPSLNLDGSNNKYRSIQFPRSISVGNSNLGDLSTFLPGYAVDALPGNATGGTLGFRLGSVSDIFNLDLKLQYLESESLGRVVSRPSISVLDNRTASIVQGSRVPFVTSSANSGPSVSFQEVGININVTPQITSDGSVILKISTKSNDVSSSSVGGNPLTNIREASTEMLVKSGRTAVMGGVFKTSDTNSRGGVPGLMNLPFVGWLFSNKSRTQVREETLIFITPYILNDPRVANSAPTSETSLNP